MTNWIEELKAGDKVFVSGNYGKSLEVVQKTTPTGGVVVNNIQYINGVNGSSIWNIFRLEQATEDKISMYKRTQFTQKVFREMKQKKTISYIQAKQINEILDLGVQEEND